MKLKKTLLAAVATLPMVCAPAYAGLQVDDWTLDTSAPAVGQGLTTVVSNIDEILFTAVAHAVWNGAPAPGVTFTTNGKGVATNFNNLSTGIIGIPELNQSVVINGNAGWELTFTWTAGGVGIPPAPGPGQPGVFFTHNNLGSISFYLDNLTDGAGVKSNPGNGLGYDDGKMFATFNLLAGEGGVLDLITSDGSDDADWLIDVANSLAGVILVAPGGYDLGQDPSTDLHTDSNFDASPIEGTAPFSYVAGGFQCGGTAANHCAKEDGSAVLTVPEPASLALLGLGLAGMGLFGRRNKKA